jgi:hypothetical protein
MIYGRPLFKSLNSSHSAGFTISMVEWEPTILTLCSTVKGKSPQVHISHVATLLLHRVSG